MAFFDDAYDRGVLRRVGGVYQFRHARLQEHLAERFVQQHQGRIARQRTMLYVRGYLAFAQPNRHGADAPERELREVLELHRRARHKLGIVTSWLLLVTLLRQSGQQDKVLDEALAYRNYVTAKVPMRHRWWYWHRQSRRLLADVLSDAGFLKEALVEYLALQSLMQDKMHGDDLEEQHAKVDEVISRVRERLRREEA